MKIRLITYKAALLNYYVLYCLIVTKTFGLSEKCRINALIVIFILASLSSCASQPANGDADIDQFEQRDYLEPINKPVFSFNLAADEYVFGPVSQGYGYIPEWGKNRVSNFLTNLNEPANVVNGVLQLDSKIATDSFWRFVFNTTIGVAGLWDVAGEHGLKYRDQNFSKTLDRYGVGEGDYIVIPIIGPSTYRGTAGLVVDSFTDPIGWFTPTVLDYARTGSEAISEREDNTDVIDQLYYKSLDPYSATRAAFLQHQAFKE